MPKKTVKIGFISLGCAKNQVDLEKLAAKLERNFVFTDDPAESDLMIVNTCGFIRPAVDEAIEAVLTARAQMPERAKLIVFGCMVERYIDEISQELPEIDFYAGVASQEKILEYIENLYPGRAAVKGQSAGLMDIERHLFNLPHYAYLKISEGCDNRCTYCAIPSIRGCHTSFPADTLVEEARALAANGAKEIIIISQDSSKYGSDLNDGSNLVYLLKKLGDALPETYFRIMYLNPDGVTEELIDAIAEMPNFIRYFDIPVQHASDDILKRMARKSRRADIERVFSMIRKKLPGAFIRTTVIAGFPGETEADFKALEDFLINYAPDYAGFFPYSPEEGTSAAKLEGSVDKKIVKSRLKTLQTIQKKNTVNRLKKEKKGEIACFVDKANDDFAFILEGRAFFQAPDVDGKLYVTDGIAAVGPGPYKAKIHKIAYPDIYVELLERL